MRAILRCPSCFTYVYDDAKACHGCGERIGKRKLLRRGSWVVIALIVCAFAATRGIKLHQDRQSRLRREFAAAERVSVVRSFLHAWLMADEAGVASMVPTRDRACKEELAKLRDLYPTVLPATEVGDVEVLSDREQNHLQRNKGKVVHPSFYSGSDAKAKANRMTAACEPTKWVGGREPFRNFVDGVDVVDRTWSLPSVDFEVEFRTDELRYTLYGKVCVDDARKITCLTLGHIEGPEGTVPVEE